VTRILVTGSTTGLGAAAARELLDLGHDVVLHARNHERVAGVTDLASRAAAVVLGDLERRDEVRSVADQVNAIGGIDAVIHNAAVYAEDARGRSPEGHPRTLAVNVLAPYLLTAWIERPKRLVFLSSDMGASGDPSLGDLDWNERRWNGVQAYCDSKLHVTTIALALARRWPDRCSNAVNPGWVPTRMGGPGAPDDLELGHRTQVWLAVSDEPDARTSGGYWFHQRRQPPPSAAVAGAFQDALLGELSRLTGVDLA
jgi:NAD(P)-dependent dehydrogenase (short-subunit alcohol dehydrogenase family)